MLQQALEGQAEDATVYFLAIIDYNEWAMSRQYHRSYDRSNSRHCWDHTVESMCQCCLTVVSSLVEVILRNKEKIHHKMEAVQANSKRREETLVEL